MSCHLSLSETSMSRLFLAAMEKFEGCIRNTHTVLTMILVSTIFFHIGNQPPYIRVEIKKKKLASIRGVQSGPWACNR